MPTSWFEDYGDCLRVNFGIFHTKIYKGSIDVANTFNLINILKTAFVIVAVLFLVSAFQ